MVDHDKTWLTVKKHGNYGRPWQTKLYLAMAGKSRSAKEYTNVSLVIRYLDFDSVAPYYVCSPQLEIVK